MQKYRKYPVKTLPKPPNKRFCINIIPQLVIFAIGVLAKGKNINKFCKNEQYNGIMFVKNTKKLITERKPPPKR